MFDATIPKISKPLMHAIEDAILLGNIKEIDSVLDLVEEEENFPETLRYGLEAMRYFRLYYGRGGMLEPASGRDKSKMLQMESIWGRELIESLDHYPDPTEVKYA